MLVWGVYVIFTSGHEYRVISRKYQLFVTQKNQLSLEPLVWALFLIFTNMAIEHPPFEDVFPVENGDFSILSTGAGFLPSKVSLYPSGATCCHCHCMQT